MSLKCDQTPPGIHTSLLWIHSPCCSDITVGLSEHHNVLDVIITDWSEVQHTVFVDLRKSSINHFYLENLNAGDLAARAGNSQWRYAASLTAHCGCCLQPLQLIGRPNARVWLQEREQ